MPCLIWIHIFLPSIAPMRRTEFIVFPLSISSHRPQAAVAGRPKPKFASGNTHADELGHAVGEWWARVQWSKWTERYKSRTKALTLRTHLASATSVSQYSGRRTANAEHNGNIVVFIPEHRVVRTAGLFNELSRGNGNAELEPSEHQHCSAHEVSRGELYHANSRKLIDSIPGHCSALTQLAVSNSTPPPATSPIPIKVKSEPVSPPRDHHMGHAQSSAGLSVTTMNNASSNISHLSHPQSHLIMTSRPNSTGHLTPTPGKLIRSLCLAPLDGELIEFRSRYRVIERLIAGRHASTQ